MGDSFAGSVRSEWLIIGGLTVLVASVGAWLSWEDALVLALVVAIVREGRRKVWAMASVLLFTAAYPPWGWPTWLFCFTPLIPL